MNVSFGFRQRAGSINWNALSSVDIEEVIGNVKVEELQEVLDNITFSTVGMSDIRNCSSDTMAKLVHIFQFTVEYLLHCQEKQNAIIHKIHDRNANLKAINQKLTQQSEALREDRRIYQRQLSILKSTVGVLQPQPPRTVLETLTTENNKKNKGSDVSGLQSILDSVLKHEKESREMLRILLEEQRNTFMKELELSHAAVSAVATSSSSSSSGRKGKEKGITFASDENINNAAVMGGYATQFDEILKSQRTHFENIKQLSADNLKESLRLEKLKIDMETKARQMLTQEQVVHNREEDLKDRIREWEQRRKRDGDRAKAKEYLTSIDSLSSLRPPTHEKAVALRAKSRALSARGIKYRFLHAITWQLGKSFRRWLDMTIERREAAQYAEQARLRTAAVASHQRREQELLELLQGEKERGVVEQAKFNTMTVLAEQDRSRLQEAIIHAEETVMTQAQHIVRLQEQLQTLQTSTGVTVDVTDTAVMTSLEYIPKYKQGSTTPPPQRRQIDTESTGTSTSNPSSPHPTAGTTRTFSFQTKAETVPSTPRVPPAVDPALYAKIQVHNKIFSSHHIICLSHLLFLSLFLSLSYHMEIEQSKLGDSTTLDEAMALAHQRITLATRTATKRRDDGAQLAAEIAERLSHAPFRSQH